MPGRRLRAWFAEHVIPAFVGRTLPIDTVVALGCARLHIPNSVPERYALIAATAFVHAMTVVTGNTADLAATGVALIDPWSAR